MAGTGHVFHENPDGAAVFGAPDGGWVYVSNSEGTPGGLLWWRDAMGHVALV